MLFKRHAVFIFLLAVLILQFATACSPSAQNMQGEKWVIFTSERASELGIADGFGQTAEYWTPTEKDALSLEGGVASFLKQNPDAFYAQGTPVWEKLDEYNRQYIGLTLSGKKIVYANYFCDSMEMDWRTDFIFVLDGGDCYLQFKYDVDSGEFFDLQVNGEA